MLPVCDYCVDVNEGPDTCPYCGMPMDHNPERTRRTREAERRLFSELNQIEEEA